MQTVFDPGTAATAEGKRLDGGGAMNTRLIVDFRGTGFTGSLKFKGRVLGLGSVTGADQTAAGFTANVSLINLNTGAVIAGDTGITVTGLYALDITGLEVLPVLTVSAGTVAVYATVNGY